MSGADVTREQWSMQCRDSGGRQRELRVFHIGSQVALRIPDLGTFWFDGARGDELASLILKAVTAANQTTTGRHERSTSLPTPRVGRVPTCGYAQ